MPRLPHRFKRLVSRGWEIVDCVQNKRTSRRRLRAFVKQTAAMWREQGYKVRTRSWNIPGSQGQTRVYCTLVKKR